MNSARTRLGLGLLFLASGLTTFVGVTEMVKDTNTRGNLTTDRLSYEQASRGEYGALTETWNVSGARSMTVDATATCTSSGGSTHSVTNRITVPAGTHQVTLVSAAQMKNWAPTQKMDCTTDDTLVGENGHPTGNPPSDGDMYLGAAGLLATATATGVLWRDKRRNRLGADETAGDTTTLLDRWAAAKAELADLTERWLSYEKDYATFLSAPAMRDYTQPTTLAAAEAMGDADDAARHAPDASWGFGDVEDAVTRLELAVARFSTDLAVAVDYAEGAALSALAPRERTVLERAQRACAIATSPGSTRGEISNALTVLRAAVKELDLPVPDTARQALDARVHPALEPSRPAPSPVTITDPATVKEHHR